MKAEKQSILLEVFEKKKYWCDREGNIFSKASRGPTAGQVHKKLLRVDKDGYLLLNIASAGTWETFKAHQVVWVYFNGASDSGLVLNHKDGNKANNRIDNLELSTSKENTRHAYQYVFVQGHLKRGKAKIDYASAEEMRRLCETGVTTKELAARFGVKYNAARSVVLGQSWSYK
jgi:hypothetical protein